MDSHHWTRPIFFLRVFMRIYACLCVFIMYCHMIDRGQ